MLTFLNFALLAGGLAAVIPLIVHLFSRKKYDEVPWAAMQFLQVSTRTRRRVRAEQMLLMLLRMIAIAALAVAMAAPQLTSSLFSRFAPAAGQRDVVLLIDGSASMAYRHEGRSASDAAKLWAADFIGTLQAGDRVAVFQARQQPRPLLGTLSADREQAINALELLAPANGGVDWPGCVQAAARSLGSGRADRDIVIITDGQRYGWADEGTVSKWDLIAQAAPPNPPRVWVATVNADRPVDPPTAALDPIVAARGVATAGREVRFRSAIRANGPPAGRVPRTVKWEIDGRTLGDATPAGTATDRLVPLEFMHKFTPGSHLVTLLMDGPALPGDNRQDFALEVLPAVPVLIVDGDERVQSARRSDFLRDALAPAKDPSPGFLVRTLGRLDFTAASLTADVKGPGTPPRVLVLANVGALTAEQNAAVENYLAGGGSVLVALGDRCDAAAWNRTAFRAGQGWLPARLVNIASTDAIAEAPKPQPASFVHSATEVFKDPLPGGLHTAVFPKRWLVDAVAGANGATGTVVGLLTSGEPFLVERGVGRGRVLLSVVPLDNSWQTNLPTLPDFVRLAHESVYYLAGARAAERNLSPGQPIVFAPRPEESPAAVTVQSPDAPPRVVPVPQWPLVIDSTREPGGYSLTTAGGRTTHFAVRSDPMESVLTPCSEEDRRRVAEAVPGLIYVMDAREVATRRGDGQQTREMGGVMMMILVSLLAGEVWYTRRLAMRGSNNGTV